MQKTLILLVILLLMNCGPSVNVNFQITQPEGVKESIHFNKKIRGKYYHCSKQEENLIITDKFILSSYQWSMKFHRKEILIDSTDTIHHDKDEAIRRIARKDGYIVQIDGDSIRITKTTLDTIFQISENQILKKFKGSYFINTQNNSGFWDVYRLNLRKDTLTFGQIIPSDNLLQYDFTQKNVETDDTGKIKSTEYQLNPTKREFKKLINPNSFFVTTCYCKMKK